MRVGERACVNKSEELCVSDRKREDGRDRVKEREETCACVFACACVEVREADRQSQYTHTLTT